MCQALCRQFTQSRDGGATIQYCSVEDAFVLNKNTLGPALGHFAAFLGRGAAIARCAFYDNSR
jgi:hypothetical protein